VNIPPLSGQTYFCKSQYNLDKVGDPLLRGANKRVVEIISTDSDYFERVIFIVKSDKASMADRSLKNQACKYIDDTQFPVAKPRRQKLNVAYNVAKYVGIAGVGATIASLLMRL